MESLKRVHQSVRDTLYEWGYAPMDIVHTTDIVYAVYQHLGDTSPTTKYHVVCMCLNGNLEDYGSGLYGINKGTNE
jgi:hypothetical protein